MSKNEENLSIAADNIDDYCSEVGCGECKINVLCNALSGDFDDVPLGDQIRRLIDK